MLYGDSYAQCVTELGTRFEDFIKESSRSSEVQLLNLGVAGFGLDQVCLLLESTVDRLGLEGSVVLVGVFIDDDLDRCGLALRGFPKPRFELRAGELRLTGVPVPTFSQYLESRPLGIRSYLMRLLTRGLSGERDGSDPLLEQRVRNLAGAILNRTVDHLEESGLTFAFVLFEGDARTAAEVPVQDWRWQVTSQVLQQRAVPFLRTRDVLRSAAILEKRDVSGFFGQLGLMADHFNEAGNKVVAEALIEFVDGLTR